MSDIALTLGSVTFQQFEVPPSIEIAGKQRLATHRLMSGAQIVDVLGRDQETVVWAGVLSGSDAAARACTLDRLRLAGQTLVLSWDVYAFEVLIASFGAEYRSPWWIPYRMTCAVVQNLSSPVAAVASGALDLISTDLATAAQFTDVSALESSLSAGDIVLGSEAYAKAVAAATSAQDAVDQQLTTAGAALGGSFSAALSACGTLASAAQGRSYLSRAVANLTGLES